MARAALNWSTYELAKRSGLSKTTVVRFENGLTRANRTTAAVLERALVEGGVAFTNGDEPGVKLKRRS
jgi:transcriptional regulator with XRE-family HTH domain